MEQAGMIGEMIAEAALSPATRAPRKNGDKLRSLTPREERTYNYFRVFSFFFDFSPARIQK